MNLDAFQQTLDQSNASALEIRKPDDSSLAPHFHITEVGSVTKEFVDCGGKRRLESACVLQTLVANDSDHRLSVAKLATILRKSMSLPLRSDMPIDVEIQGESIEIWRVASAQELDDLLVIHLKPKQTACLAEDRCGLGDALPTLDSSCCGESGCC